ncbi:MAG: hypothetical protein HGB03_03135 [Candidatus Yonathbacteria bacterium]|nr:hypothetical protein [Candidatus Yonathbacteria bacterium]NTW47373.1 hypothetical protein [Candidatus Yonathbacteria bacterium]
MKKVALFSGIGMLFAVTIGMIAIRAGKKNTTRGIVSRMPGFPFGKRPGLPMSY